MTDFLDCVRPADEGEPIDEDRAINEALLRIGGHWTGTDGTHYLVVSPSDVGNRPRWWVDSERLCPLDGPESVYDLHRLPHCDCGWVEFALVEDTTKPAIAPSDICNRSTWCGSYAHPYGPCFEKPRAVMDRTDFGPRRAVKVGWR